MIGRTQIGGFLSARPACVCVTAEADRSGRMEVSVGERTAWDPCSQSAGGYEMVMMWGRLVGALGQAGLCSRNGYFTRICEGWVSNGTHLTSFELPSFETRGDRLLCVSKRVSC